MIIKKNNQIRHLYIYNIRGFMLLKVNEYNLKTVLYKYSNKTLCIELELEDGEPYMRLTTNLEHPHQSEDQVFIKQDDEIYDQVIAVMEKAGFITSLKIQAGSGYNAYKLYKVNPICFEKSTSR